MISAISLRNVTVSKPLGGGGKSRLTILKDITVSIRAGEFFTFVGPSGAGKSTLLRIMSGLDTPDSGEIIIESSIQKKDISFVFQHFALMPWMTIFDNVALGLSAHMLSAHEKHARIVAELKRFGLEKFALAHPHELSGGMQQRVGLARAFVANPKIIFMDEPFSELDSFTASELRQELLHLWQRTTLTIVMVTHMVEEAIELSDRIAVMTPRPGRIEALLDNKLVRPRNKRTPDFFALEDELYERIKP